MLSYAKKTRYLGFLVFSIVLFFSSCTFNKSNLDNSLGQSAIILQENTSAAKIANQHTIKNLEKANLLVSTNNTNVFGDLRLTYELGLQSAAIAGNLLDRNERILGLPAESQEARIAALLSTNATIRANAKQREQFYQSQETELIIRIRALEDKLIEFGAKYEQERNKKIVSRTIWGFFGSLGITGIILLVIFVPVCIPIFTRIIAWLVSLVPQISSAFGIIAKKSVTNLSKGIGTVRRELKTNKTKTYTAEEMLKLFDTSLRENLDSDDKAIIEQLRKENNV